MGQKLLINLGNAINALCGLPLVEQLSQRPYRRCLAVCQREALGLLAASGQGAARLTPVPPAMDAALARAPRRGLHGPLARRMVAVDANARSSMWDDLEHGRATTRSTTCREEIVALAERAAARRAPANRRVVELVRDAERGGRRDWSGDELLARVTA